MLVVNGAGSVNWTVQRAVDQSSAAGHRAGAAVILDPPNPFALWREGSDGDYQTMFIELWAYLADILTFYQERIANEAFVPTATQRDSLLRLSELIDYRPGPGAGASALVAFSVQKDNVTIPASFRIGSKATPTQPAAVFETSAAINTLVAHNSIPVATALPANQFVRLGTNSTSRNVVLQGTNNRLAAGDYVLAVANENVPGMESARCFQLTWVAINKTSNTTTITWTEDSGTTYDESVKQVALYALRVNAAPFGNNAPAWNTLSPTLTSVTGSPPAPGPYYQEDWDDKTFSAYWLAAGTQVFLDGVYTAAKATPGWAVFLTDGSEPAPFHVTDARAVSIVGYTLSARVTRLTFVESIPTQTFPLRNTVILAGADRLTVQSTLPATDLVSGSSVQLNGLYPELQPGQSVVLQGNAVDPNTQQITGVAAEWRIIAGAPNQPATDQGSNTTLVTFTEALTNQYTRSGTALLANIVEATQGETVRDEVLGSGNGAAFQSFPLSKKPLTYLPSTDPEGLAAVQSTLLVTVNGVQWTEQPTLLESAANAHDFTTSLDDTGQTTVIFGDGFNGAPPPTGVNNIHARYRKGLGTSGNVDTGGIKQLIDSVPGLQKVINPLAASGGADQESIDQIRVNAPASLSTFGRAVSAADYAALALRFPNIAKATATWVRLDSNFQAVPQPYVQLTIATSDGTPIENSPTGTKLRTFLDKHRDPNIPLQIADFVPVPLNVALTIDIEDGYPRNATLAQVQAALNPNVNPDGSAGYFSLQNLQFGESIYVSAVYAVVQAITGVNDLQLNILCRADDPTTSVEDVFIRPTELAVIGTDNTGQLLLSVQLGQGGFIDT